MKRWMLIFGALDLGVVLTFAARVPGELWGLALQPVLKAGCLLIMASLVVSGHNECRMRSGPGFRGYAILLFVAIPRVALLSGE